MAKGKSNGKNNPYRRTTAPEYKPPTENETVASSKPAHVSNRKMAFWKKGVMLVIVGAFIVSTLLTGLAGMGAF